MKTIKIIYNEDECSARNALRIVRDFLAGQKTFLFNEYGIAVRHYKSSSLYRIIKKRKKKQ